MRILFIGDINGKPGRECVKQLLPGLKDELAVDFTIGNVENAASGFGVTPSVLDELFFYGLDAATSGNHIWDKKEVMNIIDSEERLLRPANYPEGVKGRGSRVFRTKNGVNIGVLNLEGRTFMTPIDCPFRIGKAEVAKLKKDAKIIIVDFHAEATSEKNALAHYLDGSITALLGTHTHVQTADERVFLGGTAYITDAGMTGPYESVIGIKKEMALERFLTSVKTKFEVAEDGAALAGCLIEADETTGLAKSIQRIYRPLN